MGILYTRGFIIQIKDNICYELINNKQKWTLQRKTLDEEPTKPKLH